MTPIGGVKFAEPSVCLVVGSLLSVSLSVALVEVTWPPVTATVAPNFFCDGAACAEPITATSAPTSSAAAPIGAATPDAKQSRRAFIPQSPILSILRWYVQPQAQTCDMSSQPFSLHEKSRGVRIARWRSDATQRSSC